jgi:periplasmic protein TonB
MTEASGRDDGVRRTLAVILSISLHGGVFALLAQHPLIADAPPPETPQPTPTRIRLDFLPPPAPPPPAIPPETPPPRPEPEPPPPPPEPEPPPPPPEPKPAPEPPPKPAPKPRPKPAPKPEKVMERPPAPAQPRETPPPPPPPQASPVVAAPVEAPVMATPPPDLAAAYREELVARIEANKHYPPLARRRNIEGTVQVRFQVDCQGRLSDLQGEGAHLLLKNAAAEAVEKSLPLAPPPGMACPREFRLNILFALE